MPHSHEACPQPDGLVIPLNFSKIQAKPSKDISPSFFSFFFCHGNNVRYSQAAPAMEMNEIAQETDRARSLQIQKKLEMFL